MAAPEDANRLALLEREERLISAKRRRLQDRIDFMRSGGDIATNQRRLDALIEEERRLSTRRRELHVEIDALRIRLDQPPGPRAS